MTTSAFSTLLEKLQTREPAKAGVIGLGYVGLPLAMNMVRGGYHVTGFDIDLSRIEKLNAGTSYIGDISDAELQKRSRDGAFRATSDFSLLHEMDVVTICVPTPLDHTLSPDVSYILSATESIKRNLRPAQLIVLESTTYPGTTNDLVRPILESTGLEVGKDFFLAFSPERISPGEKLYKFEDVPKIVGGVTPQCLTIVSTFYEGFVRRVVPVNSPNVAEMAKLLENTFRTINVALVNEMALLCDRLNMDVWEVIDAAATKPFGFMPFYPGPGLGGHCLPVDPHYLAWRARHEDFGIRFIELATHINSSMPIHVVHKVTTALNTMKKSVGGSRILMLGVAYKRGVGDTRESPAIKIAEDLLKLGAQYSYHDPFVPEFTVDGQTFHSVPIAPENLAQYDVAVIVTDHPGIDYDALVEHMPLIVDTRHAVKKNRLPGKVFSI